MVENVTRWKLLEINVEADSFLIFDGLYGNSHTYHLSDLTPNHRLEIKDVLVFESSVYILMSNSKALRLNLLTKELSQVKKSEFLTLQKLKVVS